MQRRGGSTASKKIYTHMCKGEEGALLVNRCKHTCVVEERRGTACKSLQRNMCKERKGAKLLNHSKYKCVENRRGPLQHCKTYIGRGRVGNACKPW